MKLYNICLSYFVDNGNVGADCLPFTIKEDLLVLRRLKHVLGDWNLLMHDRENKQKDLDELEAANEVLIVDCDVVCDVYSCLCEYQMELEHDISRVTQEIQDIDMKLGELETELNLVTSNIPPHLFELKSLLQSC